jgi:hypothetical protein
MAQFGVGDVIEWKRSQRYPTWITRLSRGGLTQAEIRNVLEDFKTKTLNPLSSQMDTLQARKKQDEAELVLAFFCSKCQKKHPLRDFPLNKYETCEIYEQSHATNDCLLYLNWKQCTKEPRKESNKFSLLLKNDHGNLFHQV